MPALPLQTSTSCAQEAAIASAPIASIATGQDAHGATGQAERDADKQQSAQLALAPRSSTTQTTNQQTSQPHQLTTVLTAAAAAKTSSKTQQQPTQTYMQALQGAGQAAKSTSTAPGSEGCKLQRKKLKRKQAEQQPGSPSCADNTGQEALPLPLLNSKSVLQPEDRVKVLMHLLNKKKLAVGPFMVQAKLWAPDGTQTGTTGDNLPTSSKSIATLVDGYADWAQRQLLSRKQSKLSRQSSTHASAPSKEQEGSVASESGSELSSSDLQSDQCGSEDSSVSKTAQKRAGSFLEDLAKENAALRRESERMHEEETARTSKTVPKSTSKNNDNVL